MNVEQVFSHNRQWIKDKLNHNSEYFKELVKGQSPEFLYIGCSDSRVPTETLMGVEPGEVFVHRNIANMVPNTDLNIMSVINYAVRHLKVNHVVVCGHYDCGGIKAAMQSSDFGILNPWLRNIRDVFRLHKPELIAINNEEERHRRLVELNVMEQCTNVIKTAVIQDASRKRGLQVHGWVWDIHTGKLIDLNIDYMKILDEIREIYHLD